MVIGGSYRAVATCILPSDLDVANPTPGTTQAFLQNLFHGGYENDSTSDIVLSFYTTTVYHGRIIEDITGRQALTVEICHVQLHLDFPSSVLTNICHDSTISQKL